jgi:hypothetical protein
MKTEIISLLACMMIMFSLVSAQTQVSPGILPDSPIYGLKLVWEDIVMALTRNEQDKMEYGLKLAERRLAEIEYLSRENNLTESQIVAIERANLNRLNHQEKARQRLELLRLKISERFYEETQERIEDSEMPQDIIDKINENINSIKDRLPDLKMCTMDVKQCPDGSWVARNPRNNCEFFPCKNNKVGDLFQ